MGAAIDEIRICTYHQEEERVPLVSTLAFIGAEYWCPGCGHTCGMLGAGQIVKRTKKIDDREEYWREIGKEYLAARSSQICVSLMWEGQSIPPNELPDSEKKRLQNIINEWKYQYEN